MIVAFILISFDKKRHNISDEFLEHEMVKETNVLFGQYDLLIKVKAKTNKDVAQFVINKIRPIEGVIEVKTLL